MNTVLKIVDILLEAEEDDPKAFASNLPASDLYLDPDFGDVPRSFQKLGASTAEYNYGDLDDPDPPSDRMHARDAWFYQFSKPPYHVMLDVIQQNSYGVLDKRQSFSVKVSASKNNGSSYTLLGELHANGNNVKKVAWETKEAVENADLSKPINVRAFYQALREIAARNRCRATIPYSAISRV